MMRFVFLTMILAGLGISPLAAAEKIALVIIAKGDCYAVNGDGDKRSLRRRSPVYSGDTLVTGGNSRAQIRFNDGAIVALRQESEFKVEEYLYNETQQDGKSISTLIKGGFRAMTGVIGKKKPEKYKVKTPVATIGVRGTNYEVVMAKQLYVAAWRGKVVVENQAGNLDLGEGAAYNYAAIGALDKAPKGLLEAPKALEKPAETPVAVKENQQRGTEPANTPEDGEQTAGTTREPPETLSETAAIGDAENDHEQVTLLPEEESLLNPDSIDSTDIKDLRLTDTEKQQIDRFGAMVMSGENGTTFIARSSDGANGDPIFVDNGLSPADQDFETTSTEKVIRQGQAVADQINTDATYNYTWGIWQAGAAEPAVVQVNPADPEDSKPLVGNLYWFTVDAVKPLSLSVGGIRAFNNVLLVNGAGHDGTIANMRFYANMDFDTGVIAGSMQFDTSGASVWELSFDGRVIDESVTFIAKRGMLNQQEHIDAEMPLLFTGAEAGVLAGGVHLQSTSDAGHYLDGLFLIDQVPLVELRLTQAEKSSLSHYGIASFHFGGQNQMHAGRTSPGDSGSPIITDNGFKPGDQAYAPAAVEVVLRHGSAALESTGQHATLEIDWGVWNGALTNGPAIRQTDPNDPNVRDDLNVPVYWMTFANTSPYRMANMTGTAVYDNVTMFQGAGQNGDPVANLAFSAQVDFDAGLITNGQLDVTAGSDIWQMQFDAAFNGPAIEVSNMTGNVNGAAATGKIQGGFAGDNAEAIAAGFNMQDTGANGMHVNGHFIAECAAGNCP